eukprot:UN07307
MQRDLKHVISTYLFLPASDFDLNPALCTDIAPENWKRLFWVVYSCILNSNLLILEQLLKQ